MDKLIIVAETIATGGMPALIELEARCRPDMPVHVFSYTSPGKHNIIAKRLSALSNVELNTFNGGAADLAIMTTEIKRLNPAFIVEHDTPIAAAEMNRAGINVVRFVHSTFQLDEARLLPCADHYISVSSTVYYAVEKLLKPYAEITANHSWVNTPVDVDRFNPERFDRKALREHYGFDDGDFVMLHIGTWNHNKNQRLALQVFDKLIQHHKSVDLKLVMIGSLADNFKDYWEPFVSENEHRSGTRTLPFAKNQVGIYGEQSNPEIFMAMADVMIATSLEEGNPLAVREAICMHLPVVASDIVAHRHACETAAFFAPTNNVGEWLIKLGWLAYASNRTQWRYTVKALADRKRNPDPTNYESWHPNAYIANLDGIYANFSSKQITVRQNGNKIDSWADMSQSDKIIFPVKNIDQLPCDATIRVLDPIDNTYWQKSVRLNPNDSATMTYRHGRAGYVGWGIQKEVNGKIVSNESWCCPELVCILIESGALGDTLAWLPACMAFAKRHGITLSLCVNPLLVDLVSELTDMPVYSYKEIETVRKTVGQVISIGCFDQGYTSFSKQDFDWRTVALPEIAGRQLDVMDEEMPTLKWEPDGKRRWLSYPYICISEHATTEAKKWHFRGGWQQLVDKLTDAGYTVCVVSEEPTQLNDVINWTGAHPILDRAFQIYHAEFFIGLSSGLAWLAHAVNTPVYMINAGTYDWNEFQDGCTHIGRADVCRGCWNDPKWVLSRDPVWCPSGLGFQCSRYLSPGMVFDQIEASQNESRPDTPQGE